MTEEAQALEQEEITNQEEQVEEVVEQPELSATEQKAWDQGWRPEAQFEGNPDNWKTAGEYVLYGEFQEQLKDANTRTRRKEQDFDARIANLNKLHEKQQETAINALKTQQRQAVEEADTDAYDRLQTEIDSHQPIEPVQVEHKDSVIVEWEAKNAWINNPNDEKAQQANAFFLIANAKPNATVESSLAYVDQQIAKLYPNEAPNNPRREMPTMTEQSKRPAQRNNRSRDLTMSDLTRDESDQWKMFGSGMFSNEKDFLKAVADARKQ